MYTALMSEGCRRGGVKDKKAAVLKLEHKLNLRDVSLFIAYPLKMTSLKFCRECNNVMYPKEDKAQKILLYACRSCDHQEGTDGSCIYRQEIHHSDGEPAEVLEDVTLDPTVPRTKSTRCTQCNHKEAVFFQATASEEQGVKLFFVCCNPSCRHRWRE